MGKPKRNLESGSKFTNYLITGSAGHVSPSNLQRIKNTVVKNIRKRLYDNLYPQNYEGDFGSFKDRLFTTIVKNEHEQPVDYFGYHEDRDDIFAEYLQIPKKDRHNIPNVPLVEDADYYPSKSVNKNVKYKKISQNTPINVESIDKDYNNYTFTTTPAKELLESDIPFLAKIDILPKLGENKAVNTEAYSRFFGTHILGNGYDDKGNYYSIYDLWDLDPKKDKKDISMGIGKPIEFYDRIYLDDYYGMPQNERGHTYIPEIVVTGNKK